MEKYFEKFPITSYNGFQAKNIMLRAKILDKVVNRADLNKAYELEDTVRPDNVAYQIYNDQYMSWLVYLSNKTVDPYYDWYLGQYDFDQYILSKYGTSANAENRVAYWTNNWYNDPTTISVSYYNNTLTDVAKKYYEPIFAGNSILEYKRKEIDSSVNTNEIWEYVVNADLTVSVDQKVTISNTTVVTGNAQVLFSNSSVVRIHQVFGSANVSAGTIRNGSKVANVVSSNLLYRNISLEEIVFWSPITYYDLENINNAQNKTIRLVKPSSSMDVALELKRILNP
jgi:hypothetical protein